MIIITPDLKELRDHIGLPRGTYDANINKVMNDLYTILDDESLIEQLNKLIVWVS